MSRHGAIEQDFGDGTYTFRLGLSEIEELEAKCSEAAGRDVSIFELQTLLHPEIKRARSKYIIETLRLGLIGGGKTPVDALGLVRKYCEVRPIDESRDVAYAVALAALARVHPGELGDVSGEAAAAENGSTSPPSTQEPQS